MSDEIAASPTAISVHGLSKVYRLYQKPLYRFLDLFGLCPPGSAFYSERAALKGVALTVARGEKLAIIGRNGAGKSTLLKLVVGLTRPTAGSVEVRGRISNLLQIGSGFHPDFTGRQNVYANLAHQGITGRTADRIFEEAVEFAEIEEYIDQPMKTYSTGMRSRLMFSSSVVVKPEVLVVDEILGVGDAYFTHKSFERMRELCRQEGTTLLLVTHDIYSALRICDRFLWIDRGEIRFDGDGLSAIKLYENSIKEQEEQWLRRQALSRLSGGDKAARILHVLIRSRTGFALSRPVALERLRIEDTDGGIMTLHVATGAEGWHLTQEGNLGEPQVVGGRKCRVIQTHGSIYHKAEWIVRLTEGAAPRGLAVSWCYDGDETVDVRVFDKDRRLKASGELCGSSGWQESWFPFGSPVESELDALQQTEYGTGTIRIASVELLDPDGMSVQQVRHGDPLTVRVGFHLAASTTAKEMTIALAWARAGSPYLALVHDPRLAVPEATADFRLDAHIERLPLGSGEWFLTVGAAEPDFFSRADIRYFTVEGAWYHLLRVKAPLKVLSVSHLDASGCFAVLPARLEVKPIC